MHGEQGGHSRSSGPHALAKEGPKGNPPTAALLSAAMNSAENDEHV